MIKTSKIIIVLSFFVSLISVIFGSVCLFFKIFSEDSTLFASILYGLACNAIIAFIVAFFDYRTGYRKVAVDLIYYLDSVYKIIISADCFDDDNYKRADSMGSKIDSI